MTEFDIKKRELFEELGDHALGALATCFDGKPYVRSVSCIIIDDDIYFQTDTEMRKAVHIKANPFVSVCFRHIQLSGTCVETGSPLSPENERFIGLFSKYYPHAAELYSGMENERVYRIIPSGAEVWRYADGEPYIDEFDMASEAFRSRKYEI